MSTALVVSTYPFRRPVHGGQRRLAALTDEYRRLFDRVETMAIYNPAVYGRPDVGPRDLAASVSTRGLIDATPALEDLILGASPRNDAVIAASVSRTLKEVAPTVVIFEQPYLYDGMRELLAELSTTPRVVYGSQNIESTMKRSIYASVHGLPEGAAAMALAEVERIERSITVEADLVLAVSANDAAVLDGWGASRTLVVANGVSPQTPSRIGQLDLAQSLTDRGVESYALFAGSAHPPNATGLLDMAGTRLGYLPRHRSIFLAGDVGAQLGVELTARDPFYGSAFWRRAVDRGRVDDGMLGSLLAAAHVVLLPITSGGGSNLKTAEAAYSGRRVLGTSLAFRGYDGLDTLSTVTIADDPSDFQAALVELLARRDAPVLSREDDTLRSRVRWDAILTALRPAFDDLGLLD